MSTAFPVQTPRYWGTYLTLGSLPGVGAAEINLFAGDYAMTTKGVIYVCKDPSVTPAKWLPVPGGGPIPYKAITHADSPFALSMDPSAAGFAPIGGKLAIDTSGGNVTVTMPTAAAMGTDPLVILQHMYKDTTDANTITLARPGGAAYKIQNVAGDFAWALSSSPGFPWITVFWDGANAWVF